MAKLWKMANGLATDDVAVLIAMHWGDLKVDDGFFLFFVAFGKFFWSAAFGKLKLLMVVLYEVSHCWFLLFPYLHQENCWPTWLQFGYYVPSLLKDLRIGGLCFPKTIRSQSFPSWVVEKTHGRHPGPFSGTPTFFKLLLLFFFFLVH